MSVPEIEKNNDLEIIEVRSSAECNSCLLFGSKVTLHLLKLNKYN